MKSRLLSMMVAATVVILVIIGAQACTASSESKSNEPKSSPEAVVKEFCENFFKSAPPESDLAAAEKAKNLLTERARNVASVLAGFCGVQDIPDQGYSIEKASQSGNTATVETIWKYSGGPVTKTFNLVVENGHWRIDSIE